MLPLPVKKNKFEQLTKDLSTTEHYRQISEEVLEAYKEAVLEEIRMVNAVDNRAFFYEREAEELVDIITTCITRLDILGYDASAREKLFAACNDKNRRRGYFDSSED